MTTTGTTAFNLDLSDIVEEAFERAGMELRSGYDMRTARRSLNLLTIEWANRGVNLWTIEQGSIALSSGTGTYDLPTDTIDLLEHVIRTGSGATQTDLTITRISVSTYSSIPNKNAQGRPIQVWVQRNSGADYPTSGTLAPKITVWPVPDASTPYTFVYWRLRRVQDAGDGNNTQDIPFRFLPCLVSGLAYYLALKEPEAFPRLQALKQIYDDQWDMAAGEDREKAAVRFVPRNFPIA